MNTKQTVDQLWKEMRKAINKAYANTSIPTNDQIGTCLRDYAENISCLDKLAGLLGRETAQERRYRSGRPSILGFSNETAAKLIIMGQMSIGTVFMPDATSFLVYCQAAMEAQTIGFLIRSYLSPKWHQAVESLEYAKLMQGRPS